MKVAFHAPLKSPDHPTPSGDRLMARLLIEALKRGGHEVALASQFRSFVTTPQCVVQRRLMAAVERERLAQEWREEGPPDVFFCYHPYYKAPDFLGPDLCGTFGVPYVTAEASFSARRAKDEWTETQALAAQGAAQARLNICFTSRDFEGLSQIVSREHLAMLPPFIDASRFRISVGSTPLRLVTLAMMRAGDKAASYQMLADALRLCLDLNWTLVVAGDGPARDEVRSYFAGYPDRRIKWLGERPAEEVAAMLASGDVYLWPGFGEAYGLAYLEAQACGLPVVAQEIAGVPEVVLNGFTGFLTRPGDVEDFAAAVRRLMTDEHLRKRMGEAARRFVLSERSLETAAGRLNQLLAGVVQ